VKHRHWLAAVAAAGLSIGSPAAWAQPDRASAVEKETELSLAVGETRTLPARDVRNYSDFGGIIDVRLTSDGSQFVIVGRKPGSTTLLFIRNDGSQSKINVNVFIRPPEAVEQELAQLLSGFSVRTRRIGSQIVLDGVVSSEADSNRIQAVAALYPDQVTSLVQVGQAGMVAGPAATRHLIRIDFYFVQYDKNSGYGVGIGWPESVGATAASLTYDFLAGATRSATATIAAQPLPRLDIASRHGWAKVLKQATVITNNDAEANFANGGEQNVAVNNGVTFGVERITFGTELTVLPHYDPERSELALRLVADVSDLAAAAGGTALPGRSTSRLTTNVTLKLGQSLVLSGIRTQSMAHSVGGLPGLSDIPVLGVLFGSHSQTHLQTEGAIFVVPSVIQSVPSSAAELVDLALDKFERYSGDLEGVRPYDKRPGAGANVPR
jgi:pilus assembly protein CpaC